MARKNWNARHLHPYASPSFGPRNAPFSPTSPRFLNPWPNTSPFRIQSIPHHSSPFRGHFTPHQSTPRHWNQQTSPQWSPYPQQSHSDSRRGGHWKSRRRNAHRDREQANESYNIEDYVNDSMLEDPWAHLIAPEKATDLSMDSEKIEDSIEETRPDDQKMDESIESVTTEISADDQKDDKSVETLQSGSEEAC